MGPRFWIQPLGFRILVYTNPDLWSMDTPSSSIAHDCTKHTPICFTVAFMHTKYITLIHINHSLINTLIHTDTLALILHYITLMFQIRKTCTQQDLLDIYQENALRPRENICPCSFVCSAFGFSSFAHLSHGVFGGQFLFWSCSLDFRCCVFLGVLKYGLDRQF